MPLSVKRENLRILPLESYDRVAKNQAHLKLCTLVPSPESRILKMGFLRNTPGLSLIKDTPLVYRVSDDEHIATCQQFGEAIAVGRKELEESATASKEMLLRKMGNDAAVHPSELMWAALNNGETDLCYDGQPLFDDSHPSGVAGVVNDNLLGGTGTSYAQLAADWDSACEAMQGFRFGLTNAADTRTLDVKPNAVACPPALERKLKKLFTAELLDFGSGSESNSYAGEIDPKNIFASSKLTDADDWFPMYIGDTGDGAENDQIRPLLYVENEAFTTRIKDENSDHFVDFDEYVYVGRGYWTVVPGAWYHIIKIKN